MKSAPAIAAFNSGALSPLLAGRTDLAKYGSGCRVLDNFILTVQGPARQRAGTRFVAPVKNHANKTWLVRFEFNVDNAYILEFGDQYVRFYTQHGRLEVAGVPVEVATPYAQASLFNTDGTCRLRLAQSGDFLYIFHGDYEPRILKRLGATSFTLDFFRPDGGPFKNTNATATTVYASATTGAGITLTADAAIFLAGHVGSLFMLEAKNANAVPAWEPGKAVTVGNLRRVGNRVYKALTTATTGSSTPVHTRGALFDGDAAVQWEFQDSGYGWARITAIGGGGTTATADVVQTIPDQATLVANATTRWAFAEWNAVDGWPSDVAFFRERLVAARRNQFWMSVVSDFDDFSARDPSGEVAADQAISKTLSSGDFNDIQWLLPSRDLLAGTAGGEFSIGELSNGDPLGPNNIRIRLQSSYGSRSMVPVKAGNAILFVQRAGLKVREIAYDAGEQGYVSTDRTALSEHISKPGIIDADYAQEPDSVVWHVRADGKLVGFTWNSEQNVWGWHGHTIGGGGIVESVATIPSPDGSRNEVWMVVRRTIGGATRRHVEFMEAAWDGELHDQQDAFYVDSGLTYDGAPATTIGGLSHLIGETVSVLADGSPHPQRVVNGAGQITLQRSASVVHAGYAMTAKVSPMRLDAGSSNGTSQGKRKRIASLVIRFHETSSGSAGPDEAHLQELTFRMPGDPMDQPVPPFTGDKRIDWASRDDMDAFILYVNDRPLPATVVAIYPDLQTEDNR
jgi:hypothetical protein